MPKQTTKKPGNPLGFESTLWAAADKLRNNMDAAEYKHVVLGLIFLKYISDAFEEHYTWLLEQAARPGSDYYVSDPTRRAEAAEDRDEYTGENIFWVPVEFFLMLFRNRAPVPSC